jgi:hypothetical protein
VTNKPTPASIDIADLWKQAEEMTSAMTQTQEYQRMWRMMQFSAQKLLALRAARNIPEQSDDTKLLALAESMAAEYCERCDTWLKGAEAKQRLLMDRLVE